MIKSLRLLQRFSNLSIPLQQQATASIPTLQNDYIIDPTQINPENENQKQDQEKINQDLVKSTKNAHKLKLDYGEIAYEKINEQPLNPKKPIIIFLHDVLGSMPQWKDFPEKLCKQVGLEGLIFDRLGYGQSDPINLYEKDLSYRLNYLRIQGQQYIPQMIENLYKKQKNPYQIREDENEFDEQDPQKFIIYGHSDGATIALLTAAFLPFRFRLAGLITEGPHVYVDEKTTSGLLEAQQVFEQGNYVQKLEKYQGERAQMLYDFWQETWLNPEYRQNWNILPDITNNIDCPHLIIHGKDDQFAGMEQIQDIFNVNFNTQLEVLEDCTHFPHFENQNKVIDLTSRFIKQQIL